MLLSNGGQWHSLNRGMLSRFAEHADDYSNKTEGHSQGRRSERFCRRLDESHANHRPQFATALIQMTRLRIMSSALNREV